MCPTLSESPAETLPVWEKDLPLGRVELEVALATQVG